MNRFKGWLSNAPFRKKFVPLQMFILCCVISISIISVLSVITLNRSSTIIIDDNVSDRDSLSNIIRKMYVCRVLGRDILFANDVESRYALYEEYIYAFEVLDEKMDEYLDHLGGEAELEFEAIILEKDIYKANMILSADIWMQTGDFDAALEALQAVTPIANRFFGSIDDLLDDESFAMRIALDENERLVYNILAVLFIINLLVLISVTVFMKFFSNSTTESLILLEKTVSEISKSGDMRVDIPTSLYTNDEIGKIAKVVSDMKNMLLEYSFSDALTGGYNAKAYHFELEEIFSDPKSEKRFCCVISDLNNLKQINDILGHAVGDESIRKSYQILEETFGQYGRTFRIGGDEFASLLYDCDISEVEELLPKISQLVEEATLHLEPKYSIAIGYDSFGGQTIEEFNELFRKVDKKMYDDKFASKNGRINSRVVTYDTV